MNYRSYYMNTLMIDMDDVIVGGGFLYLVNEFLK